MDQKIAALLQPGPFREFLASMPANRRYNFDSPHDCPIAQYLDAAGTPATWVGMKFVYSRTQMVLGESETPIPAGWTPALMGDPDDTTGHWTFGQALARFDAIPAVA